MLSKSLKDTFNFAKNLASKLFKKPRKKALSESNSAVVLALVGELGTGKTTFVKAFLRSLGVKRRITSPTFLIMRRYPIAKSQKPKAKSQKFSSLYHIDAYRIKSLKDSNVLGLKEILSNKKNLVLIEWADKIKNILSKNAVWIYFKHGKKENERMIEIRNHP